MEAGPLGRTGYGLRSRERTRGAGGMRIEEGRIEQKKESKKKGKKRRRGRRKK